MRYLLVAITGGGWVSHTSLHANNAERDNFVRSWDTNITPNTRWFWIDLEVPSFSYPLDFASIVAAERR